MTTIPNRRQLAKISGDDQDLLRLLESIFRQSAESAPAQIAALVEANAQNEARTAQALNASAKNASDIADVGAAAGYAMTANATATVIATVNTPVKVAGTTTGSDATSLFTNTDNRAEYAGTSTKAFAASATIRLQSTASQNLAAYIAVNGSIVADSVAFVVSDGAGLTQPVCCQSLVSLAATDFVEVFVENQTGTSDITAVDMNVVVR